MGPMGPRREHRIYLAPEAPATEAAPRAIPPTAAPSPTGHDKGGRTGAVTFTEDEGKVVRALVDAGRPGREVSSTELVEMTGIERPAVRGALQEIRAKLGIGQWEDIAEAARRRGLVDTPLDAA